MRLVKKHGRGNWALILKDGIDSGEIDKDRKQVRGRNWDLWWQTACGVLLLLCGCGRAVSRVQPHRQAAWMRVSAPPIAAWPAQYPPATPACCAAGRHEGQVAQPDQAEPHPAARDHGDRGKPAAGTQQAVGRMHGCRSRQEGLIAGSWAGFPQPQRLL